MNGKKPPCREFILAAIRTIRERPGKIGVGTHGSARLYDVWVLSTGHYSLEEFDLAINSLLAEELVVAVWRIRPVSENRWVKWRREVTTHIPSYLLDCRDGVLLRSELASEKSDTQETARNEVETIRLYVAEDGLPDSILDLQYYQDVTTEIMTAISGSQ